MTIRTIHLALPVVLGTFACTNITNDPLLPMNGPMGPAGPTGPISDREIMDLSPFAATAIAGPTGPGFELVTRTAQRAVPPATFLFSTSAGLWSGRQDQARLLLDRTAANGTILESRTVDLMDLGAGATVRDVAATPAGKLWLAVERSERLFLAAYVTTSSSASQTIGIFATAAPLERDDSRMPIAVFDGRIYVGRGLDLIVLDETTGAIVDDLSAQLQAAIGPANRAFLASLTAGHGRVLARVWPEDFDTISLDVGSGNVQGRVAGVPVGTLAATPTGFAGIDEHQQVAEFLIDRQVPMLALEQTVAFSTAPEGLAIEGGFVWVSFHYWGPQSNPAPTFVAYDPQTLNAVAGFTGAVSDGWDLGNGKTFGFAADAHSMYVVRANNYGVSPARTTLRTVDRRTGNVVREIPLDFRPSGICLEGGQLFVGESVLHRAGDIPHRPRVHVADLTTGSIVDTRVGEFATTGGLFGVTCIGAPMISSSFSRLWTSAGSAAAVDRFAHPERTLRGAGCLGGKLFTVDQEHQTLSRAAAPGVCPPAP